VQPSLPCLIFWVCVCSLRYPGCVEHAYVVSPAVNYFSIFSHKGYGFRIEFTGHKMCVLIFSATLSATFLILRRSERERDMIRNCVLVVM